MSDMLTMMFTAAIAATVIWLALRWLCVRFALPRRQRYLRTVAGVALVLLLFIPLGGVPLWVRIFSFYPNPSLPMLGVISALIWSRLLGIEVLSRSDWNAAWMFGAVAGSALYLNAMIPGGLDVYYWGWEHDGFAWALTAVACGLLAVGNRLGVFLLAAVIAHALGALESSNGWDYVIDPFFWLASLGVLVVRGARAVRRAAPGSRTPWALVRAAAR